MGFPGAISTWPRLAVVAAASLALALGLSACENVAGFTQPALVRVIDASYIAQADYPAGLNFFVEGVQIAGAFNEGNISGYGTVPVSPSALVKVTSAVGTTPALVSTNVTLTKVSAGNQFSIFLTDNGASPTLYTVTALQDQSVAAAVLHSAFRFINQAPRVGAVDIYMVPTSSTLAKAIPLFSNLAEGQSTGYISFSSQSVGMYILPTGTPVGTVSTALQPQYSFALTGGEVRTVMIIDSQLTSDPAASVVVATDVN